MLFLTRAIVKGLSDLKVGKDLWLRNLRDPVLVQFVAVSQPEKRIKSVKCDAWIQFQLTQFLIVSEDFRGCQVTAKLMAPQI